MNSVKRVRPPFLDWALKTLGPTDWVYQGSDKEATNFLVDHYFRRYPYDKYGSY